MKRLLSGNEALALGAYHAGVKVAAAYPGTPSTEIMESLATFEDIYTEWSTNEKVAMEVALGAAYGGVRALASMKQVGLNVAADPFFAAATTGINGGLVVISCDDPGIHSSQGEQDNRHYARFARVLMLEPANGQEAYELMKMAYDISERFDTPVMMRSTTRISHCKTVVDVNGTRPAGIKQASFSRQPEKYVMVPTYARMRKRAMEERMVKLSEFVETFPLNEMLLADRKLGVISNGVAYQYAREVFPNASHLKLTTIYPMPSELIRRFANEVERVIVIEELDPFIEDEIRRLGIPVTGKAFIPANGELTPEIVEEGAIRAGLLPSPVSTRPPEPAPKLPPRPPVLCPGCPHMGVEYMLRRLGYGKVDPTSKGESEGDEGAAQKVGLAITGDIGCYTLGVYAPLFALDTTACMGASIGKAHGLSKAGLKDKIIAIIGDSTFMHSGITGLVNAVYNQSNITVVILDNGTTAMTGHQEHPGTGVSIRGQQAQAVKLERIAEGVGVKNIHVVSSFDLSALKSAIRGCVEAGGPSVVIVRGDCPTRVRKYGTPLRVDAAKCSKCRLCLRLGCPAITVADGIASIDAALCVGCKVCAQVCPKKAISESKA